MTLAIVTFIVACPFIAALAHMGVGLVDWLSSEDVEMEDF